MIQSELTPIFLGSGYGAGAYFFWRTYRAERWHPSSPGVLGAAVFAGLMLIATGIHWDRASRPARCASYCRLSPSTSGRGSSRR
jgi:hypothetical protein